MRRALVICNGEMHFEKGDRAVAATECSLLCAQTAEPNKARKLGIRPDVIIGDLDSISPADKKILFRG
jgi:thiamine pyrophosphokinase